MMKPITVPEFRAFAKTVEPAAKAVIVARAFAQTEQERVNAYIQPILDRYQFQVAKEWQEPGVPTTITHTSDLYLCDADHIQLAAFYNECDRAHRAHGFTGPQGHCPALVAKTLVSRAEAEFITLTAPFFDIEPTQLVGEKREQFLDLMLASAVALKATK